MLAAIVAQPFHLAPAARAKGVHLVDDVTAARAARRQCKVEHYAPKFAGRLDDAVRHSPLLLDPGRRTSARVTRDLFDHRLRAARRDRAARHGAELFLYERAFDECMDRLGDIRRRYSRALLIGCPDPDWPQRLAKLADVVDVFDPGALFALRSGGQQIQEDHYDYGEDRYDLCIAIGTLDSVNDLPLALQLLRRALRNDAPLIGAIAGGNSLPVLRATMIEAGRATGRIVARTHPRIDPSSLAQLLSSGGFAMPVVDVDRVTLRVPSLDVLVRDLRTMGLTAVLAQRSPPMTKSEAVEAQKAFAALGSHGKTDETVEILHFIGWAQ